MWSNCGDFFKSLVLIYDLCKEIGSFSGQAISDGLCLGHFIYKLWPLLDNIPGKLWGFKFVLFPID